MRLGYEMNIYLILEDNSVVSRIELGTYQVDYQTMSGKITVICFDEFGNKVGTMIFPHKLDSFPTPNEEQQWAFAMPLIEKMQEIQ